MSMRRPWHITLRKLKSETKRFTTSAARVSAHEMAMRMLKRWLSTGRRSTRSNRRSARPRSSRRVVAAVSLFEFRAGTLQNYRPYAVTGDGQRFLINTVVETEPNAPLTVWLNWTAGVKK